MEPSNKKRRLAPKMAEKPPHEQVRLDSRSKYYMDTDRHIESAGPVQQLRYSAAGPRCSASSRAHRFRVLCSSSARCSNAHLCPSQSISIYCRLGLASAMGGRHDFRTRPLASATGISRALPLSNRDLHNPKLPQPKHEAYRSNGPTP